MVLKRQNEDSPRARSTYMWRIFIPASVTIWLLLICVLFYQYNREHAYRVENIHAILERINNLITETYDGSENIRPTLSFIENFFGDSPYSDVRVSVYNAYGHLIDYIGRPIPREFNGRTPMAEVADKNTTFSRLEDEDSSGSEEYCLISCSSSGNVYVRSALTNNFDFMDSVSDNLFLWILLFSIGAVCTVIVYMTTKRLSRSILLLHDFTTKAVTNQIIESSYKFPHDELGDISRQVVSIYRARVEAVAQSEKEHDIAMHAIEEKSRIKNQLTNNLNHELKTPIGIIKGYIDTILSDPGMPVSTQHKFLERAQANVDRLCDLLSDVSTMTRLEDGGDKIPVGEVDFHDLVYQLKNDFAQAYPDSSMAFDYSIPLGCKVRGNAGTLNSLISNLIRNALIHSHGTEMNLTLVGESDNFYTFSFADDGVGVPTDSIPHLFERFYRVDSGRSRKAGGSGLGLPIVRNVILVLGGAISVKNRSTGGLEFIFTLPKWGSER